MPPSARCTACAAGGPGGPGVQRTAESPLQSKQLPGGNSGGARGVTLETRNLLLESFVLADQFLDGRGQILYYSARSRARPSAPGRGLANPSFRHSGDVSRLLRNTLSVNTGDRPEPAFVRKSSPTLVALKSCQRKSLTAVIGRLRRRLMLASVAPMTPT